MAYTYPPLTAPATLSRLRCTGQVIASKRSVSGWLLVRRISCLAERAREPGLKTAKRTRTSLAGICGGGNGVDIRSKDGEADQDVVSRDLWGRGWVEMIYIK